MNDDLYFKYWIRFLGYDLQDLKTGKVYSKGFFYRVFTPLAEKLTLGDQLPNDWQTVERPPIVLLERNGKIKKKPILENNKK